LKNRDLQIEEDHLSRKTPEIQGELNKEKPKKENHQAPVVLQVVPPVVRLLLVLHQIVQLRNKIKEVVLIPEITETIDRLKENLNQQNEENRKLHQNEDNPFLLVNRKKPLQKTT